MVSFKFKKPKNKPELSRQTAPPSIPDGLYFACEKCKKSCLSDDFLNNHSVCPSCGQYYRLSARQRLKIIADEGTFFEIDNDIVSKDILGFSGYLEKLQAAKSQSGENEAVICGVCKIGGYKTAIFVMEHKFMMGSMGTAAGEKITRLFELAQNKRLPVVGFTVSGGARMQEGMLSLMQMAKVSAAVKRHGDYGLLYITVLTDPTMGGVTASFGMEGDIILAEPRAAVGFAGARVIEDTIRQKLPQDFQTAEFLLEKGFIDSIVPRGELKHKLALLLQMHGGIK